MKPEENCVENSPDKSCESPEMVFQKKFNEDFPSFTVVHKSECVTIRSWELNGIFLSESAIVKRTIDKQKVKKIIQNWQPQKITGVFEGSYTTARLSFEYWLALEDIKKDLGLD